MPLFFLLILIFMCFNICHAVTESFSSRRHYALVFSSVIIIQVGFFCLFCFIFVCFLLLLFVFVCFFVLICSIKSNVFSRIKKEHEVNSPRLWKHSFLQPIRVITNLMKGYAYFLGLHITLSCFESCLFIR